MGTSRLDAVQFGTVKILREAAHLIRLNCQHIQISEKMAQVSGFPGFLHADNTTDNQVVSYCSYHNTRKFTQ
jgi:hypothetical protein